MTHRSDILVERIAHNGTIVITGGRIGKMKYIGYSQRVSVQLYLSECNGYNNSQSPCTKKSK